MRPDCFFSHPNGRALDDRVDLPSRHPSTPLPPPKLTQQSTKTCSYGTKCTRPGCSFAHPEGRPCRWGRGCTNRSCCFDHPQGREIDHPQGTETQPSGARGKAPLDGVQHQTTHTRHPHPSSSSKTLLRATTPAWSGTHKRVAQSQKRKGSPTAHATWAVGASTFSLAYGDITQFKGDAIVNSANKYLRTGGGVDFAIMSAAGKEVEQERVKDRPLGRFNVRANVGDVVVTSSGALKGSVRMILHAVPPDYRYLPIARTGTWAVSWRDLDKNH